MMEFAAFQKKIGQNLPVLSLAFAEPMSGHTSFRIGGPAKIMAFPGTEEELCALLKLCCGEGIEPLILGAGTNVLAPDDGLDRLVICLKDHLSGMERVGENTIRVYAGVTMARAAVFAASQGLSGLEFAHGIPGSIGGGVYMNAGAYGGEICQVCTKVRGLAMDGTAWEKSADEMKFSYRHSILEDEGGVVVSADFTLTPKPEAEIRAYMAELMQKRRASQPLDLPSAGSAFKRPAQGYAAALIDGAGLRGYQVGNAAVSSKHAGFVVNLGGATARDVKQLLSEVAQIVEEKSGIRLEPEVRIW